MAFPTFARGNEEKVRQAVELGIIKYPSYAFIPETSQLVFVDKDIKVHKIVGDGSIIKVNSLPAIENASEDVFYLYKKVVYMKDGDVFSPLGLDVSPKVDAIELRLEIVEEKVSDLEVQVSNWEINSIPVENIINQFN